MNKEDIKDLLYDVRNEFENEIDGYNEELTDKDLDIMFKFLDNYINKVELLIEEVEEC